MWSLQSSSLTTGPLPAESAVPGWSADTSPAVGDHRSPPPAIRQPHHRKQHESLPRGESQSELEENRHYAWSRRSVQRVSPAKPADTRRTTHSHAITSIIRRIRRARTLPDLPCRQRASVPPVAAPEPSSSSSADTPRARNRTLRPSRQRARAQTVPRQRRYPISTTPAAGRHRHSPLMPVSAPARPAGGGQHSGDEGAYPPPSIYPYRPPSVTVTRNAQVTRSGMTPEERRSPVRPWLKPARWSGRWRTSPLSATRAPAARQGAAG